MDVPVRSTRRVEVADGVGLRVIEHGHGDGRAFVLVHGLASNARLWDGVAAELVRAGHRVVAVDLRGHGRSDKPDHGYDTATVADDLRVVVEATAADRPVVVGQSWGANVVVEMAARHPGVAAAVACVDGGTIELSSRFADLESCLAALRPPPLAGTPLDVLERRLRAAHPDWPETGIEGTLACFEVRTDGTVAPWLTLDRHLQVLEGLWAHRPMLRLREVDVPVLLIPAAGPDGALSATTDQELRTATEALRGVQISALVGDHDLHAQHPAAVASLLRTLADEAHDR